MTARILLVLAAVGLALGAPAAEESRPARGAAADVQDLVFFGEGRPVLIRLHVRIDGRPFREAFRQAREAYLKSLFGYLDANGDGVLNEAEARRCPAPALHLPGVTPDQAGAVNVAFNFRALDADGDGKVTPAELADYYRQFDGEALAAHFHPNPPFQGAALNDALFARLDANADGKLTRRELAAAPQTLLKLDLTDDEIVRAGAIVSGPVSVPVPAPPLVPRPAAGAGLPEGGAFFLVDPDDPPARLARQLLARYGPARLPLGERTLTRGAVGLDRDAFNRLDRNGDGRLDAAELAKFTDRPADVELVLRLGRRGRGEAVLDLVRPTGTAPLAAAVKRSRDGTLLLTLGTTQIELACNPAGLPSTFLAELRQTYRTAFRSADVNGDGAIDRKEAAESVFFRDGFARLDRNGDGKVDRAGLDRYLDRVLAPQARALANRLALVVSEEGRGLFDLLDKNRDGRLTLREMRAAAGLLAELDRNGDGRLTPDEIPRRYQLVIGQGRASLGRTAGSVLTVSPRGTLAYAGDAQAGGPLWFRKMDRNGDGDVSPREFLGSREDFKRLDVNGDGLISVEEAERAEVMRPAKEGK